MKFIISTHDTNLINKPKPQYIKKTINHKRDACGSAAPMEVIENLQEMEDEGELYETIDDVWPDYPSKEDFFFNEDEY